MLIIVTTCLLVLAVWGLEPLQQKVITTDNSNFAIVILIYSCSSLTAEEKIIVLYMSTDYVFDGTNPPYGENDAPNPLNKYGESKLDGERVTMATSEGRGQMS